MDSLIGKIKEALGNKRTSNEKMLEDIKLKAMSVPKPVNIEDHVPTINMLSKLLIEMSNIKFDDDLKIVGELQDKAKCEIYSAYKNHRDAAEDEFIARLEELRDTITNEVLYKNSQAQAEFESGNEVYLKLDEKRKELEQYVPQLTSEAMRYGITTESIEFNGLDTSVFDLDKMYDDAIAFVKSHSFEINPISKVRELINNKTGEAALLGICILIMCTPIAELVALFSLAGIGYNELTWNKRAERCAALLSLIFNVKPLEMGFKDKIDEDKLTEVDTAIDNDERMDALLDEYEKQIEELDKEETADDQWDRIQNELLHGLSDSITDFNKSINDIKVTKDKYTKEIKELIELRMSEFEEAKKLLKLLGDAQASSFIFDSRLMLGLKDGVIPEYVDVGDRNIVIRPHSDRKLMRRFLQTLLINAYCNVNILNMTVTVCDQNNMGEDLMGAYNDDTAICLKVSTGDLKASIDNMATIVQQNIKTLRGRTIREYNEECMKTGKTPINYELLFIISQGTTDNVKEPIAEFMRNSYQAGVIVWLVSENDFNNTYVFDKPFAGVSSPYEFDTTSFIIKWADNWSEIRKKSKPASLIWKDYYENAMNPYMETMWKWDCDEYVWIEPGYVDGDPNDCHHYTVGNKGDVHGIIAGTSGAGKSVYVNNCIGNMTKRHSPRDLRLWLADFKGPEFAFYLKTLDHMKVLPHVDACLCTSDPDYAKSMFKAVQVECERRFKYLTEAGFKNIYEHNKEKRKQGKENEIVPRLVFWCDEFVIILKTADSKTLEVVDTAIEITARLGRAAGVHMIFAAQDMKGAMSAGTLANFTLRMCLRCEPEVSQQILGTPYAGNIRQVNGVIYIGSATDTSKEAQRRYKTPYAPDAQLRENIDLCYDRAVAEGFKIKPMIAYQEETVHPISELEMYYDKMIAPDVAAGLTNTNGFVLLGNRMSYNPDNMAPINFRFNSKNKSNLIALFQDYNDLTNWFFSFQYNMSKWEIPPQVLYNSQVDDLHYLCKLDECVPEELKEVSLPSFGMEDIVKFLQNAYEARKASGNTEVPFVLVLLGWTNVVKFGIEGDDRKIVQPLTTLLNVIGEYNMHVVFVGNAINQTSPSVIAACVHKIVGKVDKKTAERLMDSMVPTKKTKLENGYAFYRKGDDDHSKFKIYQSELTRELENDEYVSKNIMSVI